MQTWPLHMLASPCLLASHQVFHLMLKILSLVLKTIRMMFLFPSIGILGETCQFAFSFCILQAHWTQKDYYEGRHHFESCVKIIKNISQTWRTFWQVSSILDSKHESIGGEFVHLRGNSMDTSPKSTRTRIKQERTCVKFKQKYRANCARKCTTNIACWLVTGRSRPSQSGVPSLHPPNDILTTRL